MPQGWVWTTGDDIFMPLKSCIPQGDVFMYVDIDAIDNKRNIITNPKRIPTQHAPSRATRYIQAGDTLFSMVRPYLRNIACVPQNGWIASTGFYVCSPTKLITQEYCYYLMLSDYVVNGLNQFMKGDNSPSINNRHITSWLYPVPPLEEQSRIVEEIEHWFTLVDLIEQGKANLDNTIQKAKNKILDLAIHGRLVPQDDNDEPAIELLKRINPDFTPCDNAHYPQLPSGWAICHLEDVIEYEQPTAYIVSSTNYSDSYPTPVLTAGKSFIIGFTDETAGVYNKLPCIIFDDFTTDSKYVDFPFKVKSSAMKILQVHEDLNIEYVSFFMSATRLIGDTHKRYWISEYSKLPIPLPPRNEQDQIVASIKSLYALLDTIKESL